MKTTFLFLVSALVFAGCVPKGPTPEEMITAANDLDDRYIAAFNNQDIDAMMDCYLNSPEVVSYGVSDLRTTGYDAIRESTLQMFEEMKGGTLELTSKNQIVMGDGVVGHGLWKWTAPMPDGTTFAMEGRYLDAKAMRNGKWVYLVDHVSVPMLAQDEEIAE